jgi:hypothetical protein
MRRGEQYLASPTGGHAEHAGVDRSGSFNGARLDVAAQVDFESNI